MSTTAYHRPSFGKRVGRTLQEFGIAMVLCVVIVLVVGEVSDASMRVAVIAAAFYLTVAELHRQIPDLVRHATVPLRRALRAVMLLSSDAPTVVSPSDIARIAEGIDVLTAVTRESAWSQAKAVDSIAQTLLAWHQTGEAEAREIRSRLDQISQRAAANEKLLTSILRRLEDFPTTSHLTEATAALAATESRPYWSDLTGPTWSNYDIAIERATVAAALDAIRLDRVWTIDNLLTSHADDTRVRDLASMRRQVAAVYAAVWQRSHNISPADSATQIGLLRVIQQQPETLRRLIDEVIAKIAETER